MERSQFKKAGRRALTIEEVTRLDALEVAETIVERRTPTGGIRRAGACPQCGRGVKWLYLLDGLTKCEKCHGLQRRVRQENHTLRATVRANPELLGAALDRAEAANLTDARGLESLANATKVFSAAAVTLSPESEQILDATDAPSGASLQTKILLNDIARCTGLMDKISGIIEAGQESFTDRTGIATKVPLTTRSLSQLVAALAALAQVRAARSGLACEVIENRATVGGTLEAAFKSVIAGGHKDKDGFDMRELEAIAQGKVLCPVPDRAAGTVWEVPAMDATSKN